jgi:hypothetical protein
MKDPLLEVLEDHEWLNRLMDCRAPAAVALEKYIFETVIPAAVRGSFKDDGTFNSLVADLFIEVPELRPQPKGETHE